MEQTTGDLPMKSAKTRAAAWPQRQTSASGVEQSCAASGASMPESRTRCAWISMVSPSMTDAVPAISAARAEDAAARKRQIRARAVVRSGWLLVLARD